MTGSNLIAAAAQRSAWMRTLVTASLVALPVLLVGNAVLTLAQEDGAIALGDGVRLAVDGLPVHAVLAILAVRDLPLLAAAGVLAAVRGLLGDWSRGRIFSAGSASRLRGAGNWFLGMSALILLSALATGPLVAASTGIEVANRIEVDVVPLLAAALCFLLARTMEAAAALQEEADLTI